MTKDRDIRTKPERIQISAAALILAAGILVYIFDRPGTSVYFVPDSWTAAEQTPLYFGQVGQYLPTFAHTFAFILITAAILGARRIGAIGVCIGWLVVDSLLEILQQDRIAIEAVKLIPSWFYDWPVLDALGTYLLAGRFDPLDLASIFAATVAAYLLIIISTRGDLRHAEQ